MMGSIMCSPNEVKGGEFISKIPSKGPNVSNQLQQAWDIPNLDLVVERAGTRAGEVTAATGVDTQEARRKIDLDNSCC